MRSFNKSALCPTVAAPIRLWRLSPPADALRSQCVAETRLGQIGAVDLRPSRTSAPYGARPVFPAPPFPGCFIIHFNSKSSPRCVSEPYQVSLDGLVVRAIMSLAQLRARITHSTSRKRAACRGPQICVAAVIS